MAGRDWLWNHDQTVLSSGPLLSALGSLSQVAGRAAFNSVEATDPSSRPTGREVSQLLAQFFDGSPRAGSRKPGFVFVGIRCQA